MGFPAWSTPSRDAEVLGVRPALEYPNVTLLTNAHVLKLATNPAGTAVTDVLVNHDGQTETYQGDIVVVSCGAANSAKLLLMSANDKHPNGLANGSDQVGRNYMFHNSQAVLAISKEPNPTKYQKTLGLNDFYFGHHANAANMAYSRCVRCIDCDGFPCLVHAKSDAEVLAVRPALEHPNVTLVRPTRWPRSCTTNPAGTAVTGVEVLHDGQREVYQGDIVVVSCGAANSAKLLLMSANDKHPRGLANGSDQLGRNYMFHNSQAVLALSKEPNPTQYQKTLGLNDFYFGMPGFEFPMGNIQMVGKSQGPMYRGEKPIETALAPQWTLEMIARHAVDFWLSTEDLPRSENRVTVDDEGGITLSLHPVTTKSPSRSCTTNSSRCSINSTCTTT